MHKIFELSHKSNCFNNQLQNRSEFFSFNDFDLTDLQFFPNRMRIWPFDVLVILQWYVPYLDNSEPHNIVQYRDINDWCFEGWNLPLYPNSIRSRQWSDKQLRYFHCRRYNQERNFNNKHKYAWKPKLPNRFYSFISGLANLLVVSNAIFDFFYLCTCWQSFICDNYWLSFKDLSSNKHREQLWFLHNFNTDNRNQLRVVWYEVIQFACFML